MLSAFIHAGSCGVEIAGWERHTDTFPRGKWEAYFADSAAACVAACAAHSERCQAVIWQDTVVLPFADEAKCQFVSELSGLLPGMPANVDLYTPCQSESGTRLPSFCLDKWRGLYGGRVSAPERSHYPKHTRNGSIYNFYHEICNIRTPLEKKIRIIPDKV